MRNVQTVIGAIVTILVGGACDGGETDISRCGEGVEGGAISGLNLAVVDGTVYFTRYGSGPSEDQHGVWSMPAGGGMHTCLWQGGGSRQALGGGMAVSADRIYWTSTLDDGAGAAIYSISILGGDRTEVGRFEDLDDAPVNVTVSDATIFAASTSELILVPIAGGRPRVLHASPLEEIGWSVLDRDSIYFTTTLNTGSLRRVSVGGGTVTAIAQLPGLKRGRFDRDADTACVTTSTEILRVPLDGPPTVRIIGGLVEPRSCVIVSGSAYVAVGASSPYDVVRIPLDGSRLDIVYTTSSILAQLLAQGGRLYFAGDAVIGHIDL